MSNVYDLSIDQGATFQLLITWNDPSGNPIDLTGYTARMQIRPEVTSSTVILEMTTENGGITLGGVAGTISLTKSATDTAAVTADSGVYDLELATADGIVTRLIQGSVVFNPEVTR